MLSKNLIKQIQSLHLKKFREQEKRFIAEGIKTVLEIVSEKPNIIVELFALPEFLTKNQLLLKNAGVDVTPVSEADLHKISLSGTPNQVLALCRHFGEDQIPSGPLDQPAFFLDDVRDPGNLGTIIRLCAWFGMDHLFCSENTCELYNPKVIQASMGAFLRVNVIYTNLPEVIRKHEHERIYGAVLNGKDLYRETLKKGLIVIGNEANGIRSEYLPLLTDPVTIPAAAGNTTESLNAAMAAAMISSEFFRQFNY